MHWVRKQKNGIDKYKQEHAKIEGGHRFKYSMSKIAQRRQGRNKKWGCRLVVINGMH